MVQQLAYKGTETIVQIVALCLFQNDNPSHAMAFHCNISYIGRSNSADLQNQLLLFSGHFSLLDIQAA